MSDGNDLLMRGGGKSITFGRDDSTKGVWFSGIVLEEPTSGQVMDYSTKKPKFYDNGDPVMQIIVKIQTTMREDADDDGVRALFIKSGMKRPVRDAILAAKSKGLGIGDQIAVRWIGTEDNDARIWEAAYKPAPAKANADLMGADPFGQPAATPAPAAPAPQAQPFAQQPAPVATPPANQQPAQMTPAQYAGEPAPPNVDPVMWASMDATQRAGLKQLLGLTGGAPAQRDTPPF